MWQDKWSEENSSVPAEHSQQEIHQDMPGANCLDSNFAEKDLVLLVDTKLNKRQYCALAAKSCYVSFAALGGMLPEGAGR